MVPDCPPEIQLVGWQVADSQVMSPGTVRVTPSHGSSAHAIVISIVQSEDCVQLAEPVIAL